jgi:hypothetical protein
LLRIQRSKPAKLSPNKPLNISPIAVCKSQVNQKKYLFEKLGGRHLHWLHTSYTNMLGFLRCMFGIVRGESLYVSGLILSLITMTKEQLEPYEELILSVKQKSKAQKT